MSNDVDEDEEEEGSDTASVDSTEIDCYCNGRVDDNKYLISCDMCSKWHHRKCAGLTVKQWQFLNKYPNLSWHCKACAQMIKSETPNLLQKIEQ
jgi:hypothetical protein